MLESKSFSNSFKMTVESEEFLDVTGEGEFTCKAGCMVAEKGDFKYERILLMADKSKGVFGNIVGTLKRKLFGEGLVLMRVKGKGTCVLAENCNHISKINLAARGNGSKLKVASKFLLAFTDGCSYDVGFVGTAVLAGQGLMVTELSYVDGNPQVAIMSGSNVRLMDGPCCIDPDALVAYTGDNPEFVTDIGVKTCLGLTSGETFKLKFKEGQKVIYQAGECIASDINSYINPAQETATTKFANAVSTVGAVTGAVNTVNSNNFTQV